MTIEVKNKYGKISMAEDLVSIVAGYAAVENYGIVGMCSKRTGDTLAELLGRDNLKKGIKVTPWARVWWILICMSFCSMASPFPPWLPIARAT